MSKRPIIPKQGDRLIYQTGYFQAPNDIYEIDGLNACDILVYLYLCRVGSSGNTIFPAISTIAMKTRWGETKVKESIKKLCGMRLIGKLSHEQGSHIPNIYQINTDYFIEIKQKRTESQSKMIAASYAERYPDAALGAIANQRGDTILTDNGITLAKPKML